jgi:hypothetical protein
VTVERDDTDCESAVSDHKPSADMNLNIKMKIVSQSSPNKLCTVDLNESEAHLWCVYLAHPPAQITGI